jgi:hypothetical protein
MLEYQEHHLGGGAVLVDLVRVALVQALDKGARDPGSLIFRQEAESAAGVTHSKFSELVVGLVLAMPVGDPAAPDMAAVPNRAVPNSAVPNSIEDGSKKVEPFKVTRRLNR